MSATLNLPREILLVTDTSVSEVPSSVSLFANFL